jgi:hypothetical protein
MIERLTDEELRANLLFLHDKEPTVQEIIDMHVRVVKLKEENIALRARVAKLEALLYDAKGQLLYRPEYLLCRIDAALRDAPQ